MKGVILTAKHHDGFCLWSSAYTDYSVEQSPWREGKGDLVRELATACKEYDLKLGIYLSPWDRNREEYKSQEYITYFRNQLTELLTNYGDIFEVWFDGANGGTGYYGGANEERSVARRNYYDWPGTNNWVPAEVNVSIRPGWFCHKTQDDQVKTVDKLIDVYYHSIGPNATWNLNTPIAPSGLVHRNDSAHLDDRSRADSLYDQCRQSMSSDFYY